MMEIKASTKTLIFIGSGGVGKTTMAASVAAGLAARGKTVLVLTIDPSQRLAQALGIKTDGEPQQISFPKNNGGELWAAVVDHKKTFAWFLKKASGKDESQVERLMQNRLYQQLSGRLSGSQEFTALISLYRYVSSGDYDVVILDTPPSQHTWNFLRAPEKISALFNEGVASWFRDDEEKSRGVFKKILNLGTTQVLRALEMLTGSLFMKELGAFFRAVQKWQGPLESYIMNCHRLLSTPETEFVLVTSLDSSRIHEAQKLSREIQKQGYRLNTVIINRVPVWISSAPAGHSPRLQEIYNYYRQLENELQSRLQQFKNHLQVYTCPEQRQHSEDIKALLKNDEELKPL